jgi:hypothetical protein
LNSLLFAITESMPRSSLLGLHPLWSTQTASSKRLQDAGKQ